MPDISLKSATGRWVLFSTILATSMVFIDGSALNVVLPSLQKDLNASGADIFWVLNAYLLVLAAMMLPGGSFGDKFGRKKIFGLGIVIFIIGSLLCGISPTVNFLIVSRSIQGLGGAFMVPGSLSLITSLIREQERGKAIGTWSAVTTIVSIGGPIIGGVLGDHGLWRYIFFINIPIGVISLIALWSKVPETSNEDDQSKVDLPGAFLLVAGLASITYSFLKFPSTGLQDWKVNAILVFGIVSLILFLIVEKRSASPMIRLELFSNKNFSGLNLLTFFLYGALGAGFLFLSLNYVQIQGYTQTESGLTFLPFTFILGLFSRYIGTLSDRFGTKLFLIAGPFTTGLGFLWMSFIQQTSGFHAYWTTYFPGMIIISIGMLLTVVPLTTAVMNSISQKQSGISSGVNNAVSRIAGIFANAAFGALALFLFTNIVLQKLDGSEFSANQKAKIVAETVNLGNAQVPSGNFTPTQKTTIHQLYRGAFLNSYQSVLWCCTAMCFTSSAMAYFLVRNRAGKSSDQLKA
ncbi:MFS transporter [Fluviicola sp.]|uniref:MFS transporter n=1 Tax=Fluviicola sp. TaxID=1917219 RepID=UPI0031CDC257